MAVTVDDIAVELGRATPSQGSVEFEQWQRWIDRAVKLIEKRAERVGVDFESLDPEVVDAVVTMAVVAHARKPDDSTMVDVSVDDGRVSRQYRSSNGQVTVLDDWWADLGLSIAEGAWTVDAGRRKVSSYSWTGPDRWESA